MSDSNGVDGSDEYGEDERTGYPRPNHPPTRRLGHRASVGSPVRYDFSDLTSADESAAAFRYLDKTWRIVPLDFSGQPVAIGDTEEAPIVPSWVGDPDVRVGVATGKKSGIVAVRFRRRLGKRVQRGLRKHPHLPTLENNGLGGYYVIFRAPEEVLPCQKIAEDVDFLGEGGVIFPAHHRWRTTCVELAPLPDSLRSFVLGEPLPSTKERIAAGDLGAANKATAYEAAQGYDALGLKLLPVEDYATCLATPQGTKGTFAPELWEKHPTKGIGIRTGVCSGVVGLLFADHVLLNQWRSKFGSLSSTMIDGRHPIICFRAPAEAIPSREMKRVVYLGEGGFFPAPPFTVDARQLEWEVAGPFPQCLPEVPQWLRDQLGRWQDADVAACAPRAKLAKSASKAGKGKAVPDLRKFALGYAAKGLPVFPLKPNSAEPLFKKASGDATTDPKTISRWWSKTPLANIGFPTGGASGVAVLVADTQSGIRNLAVLEEQHGTIQTPRAQDPWGRLLLFFDCPESGGGSCAGLLPGLAFLGNGSFAVLPPSRVGGQECRWADPAKKGKAKVPDWLLDLVAKQAQKGRPSTTGSVAAPDSVDRRFDRLDAWLEERCEKGRGLSEKATVLLTDFSAWSGENVTPQLFGRLLGEKGFEKKKASILWYLGLCLKET